MYQTYVKSVMRFLKAWEEISSVSRSFPCSGAHSKRVGGVEEPQVRNRPAVVDIWRAVGNFEYSTVQSMSSY